MTSNEPVIDQPARPERGEDRREGDVCLPASAAEAVAETRRLLKRAQEFSNYTDERGQAAAQMATGHMLLAIGEEIATVRGQLDQLTGIRRETAGLRQAVRELTATLAKVADPVAEAARALPDIATAISDAPDHGETLADIATAVESLVSAVDARRCWHLRRCRTRARASREGVPV